MGSQTNRGARRSVRFAGQTGRLLAIVVVMGAFGWASPAHAAGAPAAIHLSLSPTTIPADGVSTSTATATVTDLSGSGVTGQRITFSSTDSGQRFSAVTGHGNGTYTARITSSTTAGTATITATDHSSTPRLSAQAPLTQTQTPTQTPTPTPTPTPTLAASTTSLSAGAASIVTNQPVTLTATVRPSSGGGVAPTGTVAFFDGSSLIQPCTSQVLTSSDGVQTAFCTVSYPSPGQHQITAVYGGDANFGGSTSPSVSVSVSLPGTAPAPAPTLPRTVPSTMQWSFYYAPSFTRALALKVIQAPVGGKVLSKCQGRGCPFAVHTVNITTPRRCPRGEWKCHSWHFEIVNLSPLFGTHKLYPGTKITVEVVYPNWIGKYYLFTVQSGHAPRIRIACLPPGSLQPGMSC